MRAAWNAEQPHERLAVAALKSRVPVWSESKSGNKRALPTPSPIFADVRKAAASGKLSTSMRLESLGKMAPSKARGLVGLRLGGAGPQCTSGEAA